MNLQSYKENVFSQNGEDGIIKYVFDKLAIKNGTLVEYGAWDGKTLSNTYYHFKQNPDYNLIMIEGDKFKFNELVNNFKEYKNVTCINAYVSHMADNANNLNNLLHNKIHHEFQLLSIDIDGLDLETWKALDKEKFKPKIVIIEFNDWKNKNSRFQLYQTFKQDGYILLCVTGNFIFVRNDLGFPNINEEILFSQCEHQEIVAYNKKYEI